MDQASGERTILFEFGRDRIVQIEQRLGFLTRGYTLGALLASVLAIAGYFAPSETTTMAWVLPRA